MDRGKCSGCPARVLWCVTANGKRIPLDPEPAANGNIRIVEGRAVYVKASEPRLESEPLYVAHFSTCPEARQFRRAR